MYQPNPTIEPLWIIRARSGKGFEIKNHCHTRYYQMIYVLSGCFEFTINDKFHHLSDDKFNISKPGDMHGWKNVQEQSVETFEVKFIVFDERLKDALNKLPGIMDGYPFMKTLIEKIMHEKKDVDNNSQEYIILYLNTLLYDLVRVKVGGLSEDMIGEVWGSPTQITKKYIHENYSRDISLDDIAASTFFNKSYLSTVFKMNEGMTINDYIFKYRINKACELIAYSDLQLTQVSEMVGFKNIQHFNRMFKKIIGIPPGEYRNVTPKEIIHYKELIPYEEKDIIYDLEVLPIRSGQIFEIDSQTGYYRCKASKE